MTISHHLVLHAYRSGLEFERLAALVEKAAPDIRVFVLRDRRSYLRLPRIARRPTLLFSPTELRRLRLLRGTVCEGKRLSKAEELAALDAANAPVPRWFLLDTERDVTADARELGRYVVLKPNVACRGALVRIARAGRVRWKPDYAEYDGLIVQEFVYTGRWPRAYRVTTLFGEVLFSARVEANHERTPLEGRWEWRGKGKSIVANAPDGTWTLDDDADVLDAARAAARAFPDIGLLGIDIVRDEETGKCGVIEVNAAGHTWHFTSPVGRQIQQDNGIEFEQQFDGVKLAARVLAEQTRLRAT